MEVTFLEAQNGLSLSKTYHLDNNKKLVQTPYPLVRNVTSHTSKYSSLADLKKQLIAAAKQGWCMLKGTPTRPLIAESRRGSHDQSAETELLILDLDGIKGISSVNTFMQLMGMDHVQYLVQYSASMGVDPSKGLSAHIYVLLSSPASPLLLKQWLIHKNLTVPLLQEQLTLTGSGRGLRWPLDVTVCQNDKLIFIADPICKSGVKDKYAGSKRWKLENQKAASYFTLDIENYSGLTNLKLETLNGLRTEAGLDTRKTTYNKESAITNPDPTAIIAERIDEDFVRVNLANSPPSWGHWYPLMNPEILFSFKDEEPVLLRNLDSSYYERALARVNQIKAHQAEEDEHYQENLTAAMGTKPDARTGLHYLSFIDDRSDAFYIGTYNPSTDTVDLRTTRSREKVDYYLGEHGQEIPELLPRWRFEMEFSNPKVFDPENKFINMYQPSEYMRNAKKIKTPKPPKTILSVIEHITNYDQEMVEHFLNWLACKFQYRTRIGTAWLFHGTQGTGKGTLFSYVLRPIFGTANTNICLLNDMESDHNAFLPNCVLRLIDEANYESGRNGEKLRSRLWNAITEDTGTVNPKFIQPHEAKNYTDYILASNAIMPIDIDDADRRYNVCQRQESPYPGKNHIQLIEDITPELQSFADYLQSRKVNLKKAKTPITNAAKTQLAEQHQTTTSEFCHRLRRGDIHFFLDFLPSDPRTAGDETGVLVLFEEIVRMIIEREDDNKLFVHGEISIMYLFLAERIGSKSKFSMLLKKNGLAIKRLRRKGEGQPAVEIKWKIDEEAQARWKAYVTKKQPLKAVK